LLGARSERLLAFRGVNVGEADLYLTVIDQDGDRVAVGDTDDAGGEGFGASVGPGHNYGQEYRPQHHAVMLAIARPFKGQRLEYHHMAREIQ
jgi:hypothetical protein